MECAPSQYIFEKMSGRLDSGLLTEDGKSIMKKMRILLIRRKGAENMNVEQDYIMRMIKEFANVLGRLLFNKKKPMYELDVTNRYHVGDDLYTRLCRMADEGKINEAENLLYEEMVPGDMDYLEMALAFYAYLNCFEDEVLHRYHYTRDEIKEGMEDFLDRYGCSDMKELLGNKYNGKIKRRIGYTIKTADTVYCRSR